MVSCPYVFNRFVFVRTDAFFFFFFTVNETGSHRKFDDTVVRKKRAAMFDILFIVNYSVISVAKIID